MTPATCHLSMSHSQLLPHMTAPCLAMQAPWLRNPINPFMALGLHPCRATPALPLPLLTDSPTTPHSSSHTNRAPPHSSSSSTLMVQGMDVSLLTHLHLVGMLHPRGGT